MDIYANVPLSFAKAALGGDIKIATVDGDVMYTVKPGTQTDTRVRFKGKGVPSVRNSQMRGDMYVTLIVQVPTSLTREQKELLEAFDRTFGTDPNGGETKKKKGKLF